MERGNSEEACAGMAWFPGTGWSAWMTDGNAELSLPVVLAPEEFSVLGAPPDAMMRGCNDKDVAAGMAWFTVARRFVWLRDGIGKLKVLGAVPAGDWL